MRDDGGSVQGGNNGAGEEWRWRRSICLKIKATGRLAKGLEVRSKEKKYQV